jgi:hypothetical protein
MINREANIKEIDIYTNDLDVVGHYAPPDVFGLHVDTRKQTPVWLGEECKSDAPDE